MPLITNLKGEQGDPGDPGAPGADGADLVSAWDVVFDDDFSTDRLSEYTAFGGTSKTALSVASGRLKYTGRNDHQLYIPAVSVDGDTAIKIMVKVIHTSATDPYPYGLISCGFYDLTNDRQRIFQNFDRYNANSRVYHDWGTGPQTAGALSVGGFPSARPFWLVCRRGVCLSNSSQGGNQWNWEGYTQDPRLMTLDKDGTNTSGIIVDRQNDKTMTDNIGRSTVYPFIRLGDYDASGGGFGASGTANNSHFEIDEVIVATFDPTKARGSF